MTTAGGSGAGMSRRCRHSSPPVTTVARTAATLPGDAPDDELQLRDSLLALSAARPALFFTSSEQLLDAVKVYIDCMVELVQSARTRVVDQALFDSGSAPAYAALVNRARAEVGMRTFEAPWVSSPR